MLFRSVNDRIRELGENLLDSVEEIDFTCECEDAKCIGPIRMRVAQFAAIEGVKNRFIVLPGHEVLEVEDVVAERESFVIVSKRGAGADFVEVRS
jgi:hypothetical protein